MAREGELDMQQLSGFGGKGLMANAIGKVQGTVAELLRKLPLEILDTLAPGERTLHQKLRLEVTPAPGRI